MLCELTAPYLYLLPLLLTSAPYLATLQPPHQPQPRASPCFLKPIVNKVKIADPEKPLESAIET